MTLSSALASKIAHAESLISNAILDYGVDKVAIGFNGGKDCTVLLDLVSRVMSRFLNLQSAKIPAIYVIEEEPFHEVTDFIQLCEQKYPFIKIKQYPPGLRKAFSDYLEASTSKDICIFVGVRRTDPYCKHLQEVNFTDNGWPKFLRVHPLLNWSYQEIWAYIDELSVPYCDLYRHGFTSIGSVSKTRPNPQLLKADGSFSHARELKDEIHERDGRFN